MSQIPSAPKKEGKPGGLFGSSAGSTGKSLFGGDKKEDNGSGNGEKKQGIFGTTSTAGGSLFGKPFGESTTGGLFGTGNKPAEGEDKPKTSLFGAAKTGGTNIFGANKKEEESTGETNPTSGAFGSSSKPPIGGFLSGDNSKPSGGGLFGSGAAKPSTEAKTSSGGLFGSSNSKSSGQGLFSGSSNPAGGSLFGAPKTGDSKPEGSDKPSLFGKKPEDK